VASTLLVGGCTLVLSTSRRTQGEDSGDVPDAADAGTRDVGLMDVGLLDAPDAFVEVPDGDVVDAASIDAALVDGGASDDASNDASAPRTDGGLDAALAADAFADPDALTPPDAYRPPDAAAPTDAFVPSGDAARSADARTTPDALTDAFARDVGCATETGYLDGDRDGYGTGGLITGCADTIATMSGDCNDDLDTMNPGITDSLCDGIDSDCDGVRDDLEPAVQATCAWCAASGTRCETPAEIAAGAFHTCMRAESGRVFCWGLNGSGEFPGIPASSTPSAVTQTPITTATDLCATLSMTCMVLPNEVRCVGSASPTVGTWSASVPGAAEVACGFNHLCVRTSAGEVSCAGRNGNGTTVTGQVGLASGLGPFTTLNPISLPSSATSITVGTNFSCALLDDGTVRCWGADSGILGRGAMTVVGGFSHLPVPTVPIGEPVLGLAATQFGSCARTAATTYCWGYALDATLISVPSSPTYVNTPTAATTPTPLAALYAGPRLIFGRTATGPLVSWGSQGAYERALSPRSMMGSSHIPAQARPLLPGPMSISVDHMGVGFGNNSLGLGGHACAVESITHRVYCWGSNVQGQSGTVPATPGTGVAPFQDAVRVLP